MKRYIYILFAVAAVVFAGCDNEYTSNMDNSVEERYDETVSGYYSELQGAQYGWIGQLPTSKGYYQFWMTFDNKGQVQMLSDNYTSPLVNKTTPSTSLYSIKQFQRPTLVFETYCYLTILSDPNAAISGGSSTTNRGLETDFEFGIADYSDGEFTTVGRFWDREFTLRKATQDEMTAWKAGKEWDNITRAVAVTAATRPGESFYIMVDGVKVGLSIKERSVVNGIPDANGVNVTTTNFTLMDILTGNITYVDPLEVKAGFSIIGLRWTGTTYVVQIQTSSGVQEVAIQSEILPLYQLMGFGKTYTIGFSDIAIYGPNTTLATNPFGYYTNRLDLWLKAAGEGDYLTYVAYRFMSATTVTLEVAFTDAYVGRMQYNNIVWNADRSEFTVGTSISVLDGNMNWLWNGGNGPGQEFIRYFASKTYRIEWVAGATYGGDAVGQLMVTTNPIARAMVVPM